MKYRSAIVLSTYVALYAFCYFGAWMLRLELQLPAAWMPRILETLPYVLALKVGVCLASREWKRTFRYTSFGDIGHIGAGALASMLFLFVANMTILRSTPISRSVIVIDAGLTVLMLGMVRGALRLSLETRRTYLAQTRTERTLIYGADQTGIAILRALETSETRYRVVGFLDPEASVHRALLAGVPVLQGRSLTKLARKRNVGHLLIPATLNGRRIRELVGSCAEAGVKAHVIPGVEEIVDGRYRLGIREVTISDLLRREPAQLDMAGIRQHLAGRRVMVTGGAGSIGSEICRQLLSFEPQALIVLDQCEFGMFTIQQELVAHPEAACCRYVIADVADRDTMVRVMELHRPEVIFHAAAYKHVPLMEDNPQEAIRNNVFGTKCVVDLAHEMRVERFVLISTDKAVRPTSTMGATKLMAEKYLQAVSSQSSTQFLTVRFGNVLNSAGSVVPTFRRQIEAGGPVTVTHPEMVRFFMTIPEAVQLVLQASAIGGSGDVLILDMGEPVSILQLARDMIALSGLRTPEDIEIEFTGIRPGEKLYEEIFYDVEQSSSKVHDKIYRASRAPLALAEFGRDVDRLEAAIEQSSAEAIKTLHAVVAECIVRDERANAPARRAA